MRSTINIFVSVVVGGIFVLASNATRSPLQSQPWQTPAQWHRLLKKPVPGILLLDDGGVEFRSAKFNQRWPYMEIHSFDLLTQELTLTSYQNAGEILKYFDSMLITVLENLMRVYLNARIQKQTLVAAQT